MKKTLLPLFLLALSLVFAPKALASSPSDYIVVFTPGISRAQEVAAEIAHVHELTPTYIYTSAIQGFAATIPPAKLARLQADPRVAFISEDREVYAFGKPSGNIIQPAETLPWGITRIGAPVSNKGTGIGVAVIDTGIDLRHPDLQANISGDVSCIRGKKNGQDDNGHGSHVAGTIAALDNEIGVVGVASLAKLFAVKVLNSAGSGTWSSVICGIDWVTANAATRGIKVANMSLGGGGSMDAPCATTSDALHKAICNSTAQGVTYVVAAGNESDDASNHVPAAYDDTVITVSAINSSDLFPSFSNFGSVVDLAAPGVSILSTWKGGSYNTISGTSMATPHVAGAAALYLSNHSGSSWNDVRTGLLGLSESLSGGSLHPEPLVKVNSL